MRKTTKSAGEKIVKDIKRATRKQYTSEEKIWIVLDGLRGEDSIAELCRREGISQGLYYKWSKTSWRLARSVWLAIRRGLRARPITLQVRRSDVASFWRVWTTA